MDSRDGTFDVAIVGGGPAGLAAALILGRMRRRVLLVDSDDPAHAVSEGVHGLFGHDGLPPRELRALGREQLQPYASVTVRMAAVDDLAATPRGFRVVAGGETAEAGIVLLCTGMRTVLPPIDGLTELWGKGIFHCPCCHGWEVRDRPVAAYGLSAAGLALMMTSLSDDIVLFTDGGPRPEGEQAEALARAGVEVRDDAVARVEPATGHAVRIVFADGSTDERGALFVMPAFTTSELPRRLGCEVNEAGEVVVDGDGHTSAPGVFAAGDLTGDRRAVILAAAAGSRAAYVLNGELARGVLPATASMASIG
jgi:thioredoxin reductase